jgi:hypothetical protein
MFSYSRTRLGGLAALLILCWTAAGPGAGAADLKYLPEDTEIVLSLNFRQIVDSPLVKAQKDAAAKVKMRVEDALAALVEKAFGENKEVQKYLKATGFDVFRDLNAVTVALRGGHDKKVALAIIEGNFDPEKFHAAAAAAVKDHGDVISVSESDNYKIIEVSAPNDHSGVVVLVNKNTILAGPSKDRVKAALVRARASEPGKLKKELKLLLATTSDKESISALATGTALSKLTDKAAVPNAQKLGEFLNKIDGLSGTVTFSDNVRLQLSVLAKDENSAMQLAQAANFGLLMAKGVAAQKAKEDPNYVPLVDIANTFRATAQGTSLILRGEITVSNIEKLMKAFP